VNARIYTLPEEPPPVYVSGLAPASTELASEVADGFVTFSPELLTQYRGSGGRGIVQTAMKVCFDVDEANAVGIVHRLWATELNPGQLNRELAQPRHIESAASLVTPEMVAEEFTCGSDPDRHVSSIKERIDAGYDEIYIQQVGPDMDGFFDLYGSHVLPVLRTGGRRDVGSEGSRRR
jgi:G6PDH family F420-dependent oxidoreductase